MLKINGNLIFYFNYVSILFFFLYSARILPPPEVKYRGQGNNGVAERVAVGKWAIRNRFHNTPTINKWGIIYFGSKPDQRIISILQEFENQFPSVSHHYLFPLS